jgi:hypothetical protein
MTDKNLLGRWCRLIKIAPNENIKKAERSWSDKSKNLLTFEQKIYAIRVADGELEAIHSGYHSMDLNKKKSKPLDERVKKWITKCKWKVPKVAIVISLLQVSRF